MKLIILLVFLAFLLSGCSKPVVCTTPYILSGGTCCLDKNSDSVCDEGQHLVDIQGKQLVSSEELPDVEIERPLQGMQTVRTASIGRKTLSLQEGPALGNKDASVTLIVFGDYAHRMSQRFNNEVVPKILERYGDVIRYIYRDLPASTKAYHLHPAEAAQCAHEQGKFWEYHQLLFADVSRLSFTYLEEYAQYTGLDIEAFQLCMATHTYSENVFETMDAARAYGVTTLPTVFINRKKISGYRDYPYYKNFLDEVLQGELARKIESRRMISVDAVGRAHLILKGASVVDPTVTDTLYSNSVDIVDANLYVQAYDVLLGGTTRQDAATLTATVTIKLYGELTKNVYKVKLKTLDTQEKYDGGVATDIDVFGDTGIVTSLLPKARAHIAIFGKADVYDEIDRLLAKDLTFYFFLTEGIRERGLLTGMVDKADTEAYVIFPGTYIGEKFPNEQGFLHLFFESVSYRII